MQNDSVEKVFCIYCKNELSSKEDIKHQFHSSCKKEIDKLSVTEYFVEFSDELVNDFLTKLKKLKNRLTKSLLLYFVIIFGFTISIISMELYSFIIPSLAIWIIGLIYFLNVSNKINNKILFSKVIQKFPPDKISLTNTNCIGVYEKANIVIINRYSFNYFFNGLIFVKVFISKNKILSHDLKISTFPNRRKFLYKYLSLAISRSYTKCQIPIDNIYALEDYYRLYWIRNIDMDLLSRDFENLFYLIQKGELDYDPNFRELSDSEKNWRKYIPASIYELLGIIFITIFYSLLRFQYI